MTYEEVFQFIQYSNRWLSDHQDETKIHYALRKVTKSASKIVAAYQEKVEEMSIDNCSVDEKGIILRDERNEYKFTKDGLKKRNADRRKLYDSEVAITPFYVIDKSLLSEADIEAFRGFIVEAEEQEK